MYYKEHKKIKRQSEPHLHFETIIADDFRKQYFSHSILTGRDQKPETVLQITKEEHSAGIRVEITQYGKRSQSISVELGRSEIDMLREFLDKVDSAIREYNGQRVPVKLIDLTQK